MAKFSERRRSVSRVIQPSTRSTLGEYDSRPPLARYVWYFTSYLRSSCCSETHVRPRLLPVFLPLSTLDVTHVRRCTRPSPLYRTKQRRKAGRGTGNEATENQHSQQSNCTKDLVKVLTWECSCDCAVYGPRSDPPDHVQPTTSSAMR